MVCGRDRHRGPETGGGARRTSLPSSRRSPAAEQNFSEETFRIFEFDPSVQVNFQMVRDTIHPEDQPTFDAVIARAMTDEDDFEFGFRIVTSRGAVKHLRGVTR